MLSSVRASDANDHKRCGRGDKDVRCALQLFGCKRACGATHTSLKAPRSQDCLPRRRRDVRLEDALFMHALFRRGER